MSVRGELRPLARGGVGVRRGEGACDHVYEEQQAEPWAAHILHKAATCGCQWASLRTIRGALTASRPGCATVVCCVLYITLYVAYAPSSTTADDNRLQQPVLQYVLGR